MRKFSQCLRNMNHAATLFYVLATIYKQMAFSQAVKWPECLATGPDRSKLIFFLFAVVSVVIR